MPYSTIEDLPQDIQDKYPPAAREAFLSAFNGFMDDCTLSPDKCEEGAFKRAYSAANRIRDSQKSDNSTLVSIPFYNNSDIEYIQNEIRKQYPNGEYLKPDEYHISLIYFPNGETSIKPILDKRFDIETSHYEIWDTKDGYAYVMRFNSKKLFDLQKLNVESLPQNIEYSEYHKIENYKPHLTLAYFKDKPELLNLPKIKLHVGLVILDRWGEILADSVKMLTLDNESKTLLQKFVGLFARKSNDLITGESGFKSLGNNKWIAWYTNAYLDKHNEIIATKAIEEDTAYMNESGNYPDLRFYHIKGSTHGKAMWAGNIGRYGVAIGEYFTDETSQKFKTWAESNPVKLSHGFYYSPAYKDDNVFNKIRTFEISILPEGKEANPYTSFNIYKEDSKMAITKEQLQALKQIVGDHVAQEIIKNSELATKSNDEKLVYKAEMIEEEKEEVVTEEEVMEEESPEESSDALIKSMAKMVTEMYNLIKSAAGESEPVPEMDNGIKSEDTIEQLKAELATLKANQEKQENQEFVLDLAEIMKDFNNESSPALKYHPDTLAGAKSLFGFEEKSN